MGDTEMAGDQGLNSNDKPEQPQPASQEPHRSALNIWLRTFGCLFGVHVDNNDGSRISSRAVARSKTEGQSYLSTWICRNSDVVTEVIHTYSGRDTNYVHDGWSQIATRTTPIWTSLRIAKNNNVTYDSYHVTKRTTFRQLMLDIPLNDLVPSPEFEEDIKTALSESSNLGRFQALDRVFSFWGDVIPLTLDFGTSLTSTTMGRSVPELPDGKPDFHIQDLLVNGTTRVSLKIRNQTSGQGSVIESLAGATQPQQWVRTRVRRVVPVTKLLPDDLQNNIESLYSKLLSYHPIYFDGIGEHGGSFDGTSHALKTISSIVVQSSGFIHSLTVSYQDGSFSEQYGGPSNRKHTFQLRSGESVVEVLVWREPSLEAMSGIQFITSLGRVSPHYGGHGGIPTVLRSTDGCLVAFCGRSINHSEAKETNMIDQLQAIWRHDIMKTPEFQYSDYLGGSGGFPFNDRVFVGASGAGFIKSIRVNCSVDDVQSWCVENIQIEYAVSSSGSTNYSMGPSHGGVKAQKEMLFELEPGEHITAALGWANDWISQISFATNKGRVSPLCGQEQGTAFRCQAPVSEHGGLMRLSHIVGKSGDWLNGLLFVWAPP